MDLREAPGAMIAISMIVLIAAAGGIALDDFKDNIADDIGLTTTTNESVTASANVVTIPLGGGEWVESIDNVIVNQTVGTWLVLTTSNYTASNTGVDYRGGATVTFVGSAFNGNQTLITYTSKTSDNAINISFYGLDSEMNVTNLMSTIGTVIGAAILIFIIVGAFMLMQR